VEWGWEGAGRGPRGVVAGGGGRVVARRTKCQGEDAGGLERWSAGALERKPVRRAKEREREREKKE